MRRLHDVFPLALVIALMSALFIVPSPAAAQAPLTAARLRCEYKTDPLAVDVTRPRLSWIVIGDGRGRRQTAYRILAAGSQDTLKRDRGDLWDSGKVASAETTQIAYAGKPLLSRQAVYWKVRVWDERGRESRWSPAATWSMGLLRPDDWNARWIAAPAAPDPDAVGLDSARWIWHAADGANPPAATRWFRRTFDLPAGAAVTQARLAITADDRFVVSINGKRRAGPTHTDSWKNVQVHDVAADLRAGSNEIVVEATNTGVGPAGLIAHLAVRTGTGNVMLDTDAGWQAAATAGGPFAPARMVGENGVAPWGRIGSALNRMLPAPYFRKAFSLERKPIRRAVLYATALGLYEVSLNGKRVGDDFLSPGWTDYKKRVHYLAYDVTKQLKSGDNTLGAILGDGWYAGFVGYTGRRRLYGDEPMLRVMLSVEYADGARVSLGTDGTWKTTDGPIRTNDLLMGTATDTRREMPGWDAPGFDDSAWRAAEVWDNPASLVLAHPGEPIRASAHLTARARTEPKPGVFIYDIGQNLSGWVRLTVDGKPGQTITLRHGERLNPDGTLYTTNLRAAKATDTFVLRGGRQTLEPKFTFHGFQYVEITGTDAPPAAKEVTAVAVNSEMERTLTFESDNPLLNRLVENIDWGFRGNALDIPTDCPQRDERLGWTGDAQVFAKTAMLVRGTAPFFTKWLVDLCEDGQAPDGSLPDVAPRIGGGGNAAWEDAGVVVTYRMYEMYGDTAVIARHWPSLTRYMEHLAQVAPDGIRGPGAYGDWLLLDGPQKSAVHGTAYYYLCAKLMGEMAAALGKTGEAEQYKALAARVRSAFIARFVTDDGQVQDGGKTSQTFYALALAWDLLPAEKRDAATQRLVALIDARGGHLATGFIGTPVLLPALAGAGRADRAHRLLLNETYPSWLFPVKLGATTMWERWDGWTPERGFQDPGMNSFNHYWLGCVAEWLVTGVAGIDTVGPGFREIRIRPHLSDALPRGRVVYDSIRGPIECAWVKKGSKVELNVSVPANTVATIYVPMPLPSVTESGKPLRQAPGVTVLQPLTTQFAARVGSGTYRFEIYPLVEAR